MATARVCTVGSEWDDSVANTSRDAGRRLGSDREDGKRTIKIDKMSRASMSVSGGRLDYFDNI